MELAQIALSLGIAKYPPALDEVYAAGNLFDPCDQQLLKELEAEFGIFEGYYAAMEQAMEEIPADEHRYIWAKVVATYIRTAPVQLASKIPMPASNGTVAGDLLPMVILLPLIPSAVESYRRMGFPQEDIQKMMCAFRKGIAIVARSVGRPAVNQLYYWWLCLYAKASIFHCGDFQFELRQLPNEAIFLRNKADGCLAAVMTAGRFHKSGMVLGSGGYLDEEGAFDAQFRETENAWYGSLATERAIGRQEVCFPKDAWEVALKPGDWVLSMHIARGANLREEAVDAAINQAKIIAGRCYPQWVSNGFYCRSWLLDPLLGDILGEGSRIFQFANRFTRLPIKSSGRAGFGYVFPADVADADLPEDTTLRRGLKQHYLSGGFVMDRAGAFIRK